MSLEIDPHRIEGVSRRERRGPGPWPWLAVLFLVLLVLSLVVRPNFFKEELPEPGEPPEHEGAGVGQPPVIPPEEPIIAPADPDPPVAEVTRVKAGTDIQKLSKCCKRRRRTPRRQRISCWSAWYAIRQTRMRQSLTFGLLKS